MPLVRNVVGWLREQSDFNALFNQAISDRLTIFEEDIVRIADDMSRDVKVNKKGEQLPDTAAVTRDKLRIEVRHRHLKAGRPQKWGEKSTVITKSGDEFDPSSLSDDELEQKIADIDAKFDVRNKYDRA
jgi:hypothetical protein